MATQLGRASLSLLALALASAPLAARPAGSIPTVQGIDNQDRVLVPGNVHSALANAQILGHADRNAPMERMILSLKMDPDAQYRLEQLLKDQQDPASPSYHKWLSPEEFGEQFGPSAAKVAQVRSWLESQGFSIDEVAPSRLTINFTGDVQKVERAFQTAIMNYRVDGEVRHANMSDPTIPRALADVVHGVVSLHNIPRQAYNTGFRKLSDEAAAQVRARGLAAEGTAPQYTSGTTAYMAPNDFKVIYNLSPLYSASPTNINGAGTTICIVGRTNIALTDVTGFRSAMGLAANAPTIVLNGTDPGDLGGGEETEADLDVEWSGAVGRGATVKFVVSKSTTSDGVDLSAQYIVNNANTLGVSVMSTSFGNCEANMGTTENNFYNNLWSQAASEGITSFVSAGDAGAAGCNGGGDTTGSGQAVNGLSSTPYNICVGGTQFNEGSSFSTYWGSSNGTDYSSALKYIPETSWNESGTVSGGANLWSTGGGVSTKYAKPSWQSMTGVPNDAKRDCPDVSLTAASHDGYIIEQGGSLGVVGGTSASSPSFAGLMSLIVQKTGAKQGNANTNFYKLARYQFAGGATVYHDITSGNNSVPGTTGFSCGTGYDCVTGLGSVDANALVTNWVDTTPPSGTFDVKQGGVSVNNKTVSGTVVLTATATDSGSGVARVTFYVDGAFYTSVSSSPYNANLDTTKLTNGTHNLLAYVTDNAGNIAYTTPDHAHITASNADTTGPTGSTTITGTSGTITFSTTVTDPSGVGRVTYYVDGAFYKSIYASPFQTTIDSTKLSNGTHHVLTYAVDSLGNTSYLDHGKAFTVSN